MAEVQFELAGDAKVQVTVSEAQGGTLLCHFVLPGCFSGVSGASLTVTTAQGVIRQNVPITTAKLDDEASTAQTASIFLNHHSFTSTLQGISSAHITLDAIDANDQVLELQGDVPDLAPSDRTVFQHEALFAEMLEDDDIIIEAHPTTHSHPDEIKEGSIRPTAVQIAERASANIAQHYEEDIEDSFIMVVDYGDMT